MIINSHSQFVEFINAPFGDHGRICCAVIFDRPEFPSSFVDSVQDVAINVRGVDGDEIKFFDINVEIWPENLTVESDGDGSYSANVCIAIDTGGNFLVSNHPAGEECVEVRVQLDIDLVLSAVGLRLNEDKTFSVSSINVDVSSASMFFNYSDYPKFVSEDIPPRSSDVEEISRLVSAEFYMDR